MRETDIGPEDPAAAMAATAPRGLDARPAAQPPEQPRERPAAWRRWSGWLVIAVPAVTSLAVGGYEIGRPSLWRDEAYTKDAITRPFGQIFALLGHQDAVHGAYYLVMHVIAAAIGTSATALRLPSLAAMVIATGFTAAAGRRAAARALAPDAGRRLDVPALTGLLSGLLFATAPYMTYYTQMARSYAIETMFAVIATYLLLRACPDGRWRWWSAYGAAVALTGLFNVFGLLILAAHGVTLLLTDARGQAGTGRRIGRIPVRWLAVSAAAVVVLFPLLGVAGREQKQIAWLTRPNVKAMERLLTDLAGSRQLILPFALLALAGLAAAWLADGWRPLNPVAIALPWLVMPPFVLIAVSFVKPVYYVRYVEFCLPALAILAGAGLAGLIRLAAVTPLGRLRLAWLPRRAGRRGARRPAGGAAAGDQADRRPPGQPAAGLRHRGGPRATGRRGLLHPARHAGARHRLPGAVPAAPQHRAGRVADRLGHPDRHRGHQPGRAEEPVHRRQARLGGHRRQQLQVPRPVHPGRQGKAGAARRMAHPAPLAGRRGHAHPVRLLTPRPGAG